MVLRITRAQHSLPSSEPHGDTAGNRSIGSDEVARKLILLKKKIKLIEGARKKSPHYNSTSAGQLGPPAGVWGWQNHGPRGPSPWILQIPVRVTSPDTCYLTEGKRIAEGAEVASPLTQRCRRYPRRSDWVQCHHKGLLIVPALAVKAPSNCLCVFFVFVFVF